MMRRILGMAALIPLVVQAGEVSQFRGTSGLGVSDQKDAPLTWSVKEGIRWKASLPGRGLSNPVIADGRVYATAASRVNQNRLHVLCFDEKAGKLLWERQFWATGHTQCHPKTNMAAPTPVTDGKRVYALFATADLVCLDKDGDLLWARSLAGDYPTIGNNVGMASSPVLAGDVLCVHMENVGESFAIGIDAATGKNRWRVERPRIINWNTPFVFTEAGQSQVLFATPEELTALDPKTGRKLWSFTKMRFATSSSVVGGDGLLFIPGDKLTGLRPGSDGVEPEVAWQNPKLNVGYCSPTLYRGRLYTLSNRGVVSCADPKTGNVLWAHRVEGTFAASPLAAAGRIYLTSEDGTTYVMQAGDEAKLLATNETPETILASPVAANGAIYLRSDKHLYCIGK